MAKNRSPYCVTEYGHNRRQKLVKGKVVEYVDNRQRQTLDVNDVAPTSGGSTLYIIIVFLLFVGSGLVAYALSLN